MCVLFLNWIFDLQSTGHFPGNHLDYSGRFDDPLPMEIKKSRCGSREAPRNSQRDIWVLGLCFFSSGTRLFKPSP